LQILSSGELIGRAVPVVELINLAYDVPDNPTPRLSSLPDWADRERFDIEAKASASLNLGGEEIPAQKRTIQKLIQSLLADSFNLALSVRTERIPFTCFLYPREVQSWKGARSLRASALGLYQHDRIRLLNRGDGLP
jgi:uncharacterized protein (TIGR03435 family)